jgi:hypothetical protein
MITTSLHFLLRMALAALNLVLNYLIQPLPRPQVWLVRVAAVVSVSAAAAMLAQGASGGQSLAPFFLLLVASRPVPARGRWKFALVMGGLFVLVGGIPLSWLQAHGWL